MADTLGSRYDDLDVRPNSVQGHPEFRRFQKLFTTLDPNLVNVKCFRAMVYDDKTSGTVTRQLCSLVPIVRIATIVA
jgi:hypothetical protein